MPPDPRPIVQAHHDADAAELAVADAKLARKKAYAKLDRENVEVKDTKSAIKPARERLTEALTRAIWCKDDDAAPTLAEIVEAGSALKSVENAHQDAKDARKAAREALPESVAFTEAVDRLGLALERRMDALRALAKAYPLFAREIGEDAA
jgi:hypothetical protein